MRTRHRRGVTFLEIMVALVILGIMMALVLPNLSGPRSKAALRASAREITQAAMLARQRAIVQGHDTYLIVYPERSEWRIYATPPEEDEDRRDFDLEDIEATTGEERIHKLHTRVDFERIEVDYEEQDLDEMHSITFRPNGTSTGMAVQLKNDRDRSMTVDIETLNSMPTVYLGEPKSFAQKLKEHGLNPADYGIRDDTLTASSGSRPGEGFYRSAGMTEEERVDYYKDAAERILERAQTQYRVKEEGAGAYYSEAARWGN